MDIVAPLIADREPAVLRKPGQCTLHHPPVLPQLLAALYPLSCYPALYPAPSQSSLALFVGVSFVGLQLLGTFPRPTPTGTLDGLYSVDELFEDHRVVHVGSGGDHSERDPFSVRNKVALGALLSFIRRIVGGFWAPLLAGMEAESSEARSQSIWSASPRRSRRTRCRASPTPQPLATPSGVASKSSPSRSPSLGAASPRGCRSLARRRCPSELPGRRCAVYRLGVLAVREVGALRWFPTVRL